MKMCLLRIHKQVAFCLSKCKLYCCFFTQTIQCLTRATDMTLCSRLNGSAFCCLVTETSLKVDGVWLFLIKTLEKELYWQILPLLAYKGNISSWRILEVKSEVPETSLLSIGSCLPHGQSIGYAPFRGS